ncbi:MAG: hypothetical protein PW788_04700 [Micavibrio sp.]|nr:hypothetical protein [Micavibrio sp.]
MRHANDKNDFFTRSLVEVFVVAASSLDAYNLSYNPASARPARRNHSFQVQQARINLNNGRGGNDGWDQPPMMSV